MLVFIIQSSHVEILEKSSVFIQGVLKLLASSLHFLCQKLCLHFLHTYEETIIFSLPKKTWLGTHYRFTLHSMNIMICRSVCPPVQIYGTQIENHPPGPSQQAYRAIWIILLLAHLHVYKSKKLQCQLYIYIIILLLHLFY